MNPTKNIANIKGQKKNRLPLSIVRYSSILTLTISLKLPVEYAIVALSINSFMKITLPCNCEPISALTSGFCEIKEIKKIINKVKNVGINVKTTAQLITFLSDDFLKRIKRNPKRE